LHFELSAGYISSPLGVLTGISILHTVAASKKGPAPFVIATEVVCMDVWLVKRMLDAWGY
jgi:hypothetical protein